MINATERPFQIMVQLLDPIEKLAGIRNTGVHRFCRLRDTGLNDEPMTLNDQKCAFSEAWLRAVAACAGFGVQGGTCPDDQSVDITLASTLKGIMTKPRLDVQLKCTAAILEKQSHVKFVLPKNNYEDLRDANASIPKILVVVQVPEDDPAKWLASTPERLEAYRAAWWVSLRGWAENTNGESTTIDIPPHQRFTPSALRDIMQGLAEGVLP